MALQDILKKILEDGATQVANLKTQFEADKKALEVASEKQGAQEFSDLEVKTTEAIASLETKTKSMARREHSRLLLLAKQGVVKTALTDFLAHLEKLEDGVYVKVLKKLCQPITLTSGMVYVPKDRLEITKKNMPGTFDFKVDDSIKGGFVLKSGGAEIDNSFSNLVFSEYKSELEIYFADQLKLS